MMKVPQLIVLFILFTLVSAAQVISFEKEGILDIADKVEVLEDPDQSITIEDLIGNNSAYNFQEATSPILNFGFTTSSFWLKFSVTNQVEEDLILEFASPHLKEVILYKIEDGNVMSKQINGYSIPVEQKKIKHHFQLFELKDEDATYIARLSSPLQPVPLRLANKSRYEIKKYRQLLFFGFVVGFMIFVILSNLFFFYSLKNKLFLFYAFMAVLYLSYSAFVMDGFIVYFLQGVDLQFWYIHIPSLGTILHVVYAMTFLEIKTYAPKVHKVMSMLAGYFLVYFIFKIVLPYEAIYAINTLNAFLSFFAMCYMGYKAGKNGNRLGYYFGAAYLIYFILVLTEGTYVQLGAPGYLAELSHVTWATLIEAFILSFLLSKRFEWEQKETEEAKRAAQKQALEQTIENQRIIKEQNIILEAKVDERTNELKLSLENLKSTQAKLIQSEKLASLGELTAGIAHEIQNPLNFVNNFADLNVELLDELEEYIEKGDKQEVEDLINDIQLNLKKIHQHGQRADSIVKSMLLHSRTSSGEKESLSLNDLCEEYTKLSYHGFRAKDRSFTANYNLELDDRIPKIKVVGQDFGRVILNLVGNAFYAVNKKYMELTEDERSDFKPMVKLRTLFENEKVIISIEDNGTGIPESIQEKVFQPFFTTKPTGKGTGLGLSLSFDIVTSYNGTINLETKQGEGTTFTIELPLKYLT